MCQHVADVELAAIIMDRRAISRTLFPPRLKTVNCPTRSAPGNARRNSTKLWKRAVRTSRQQWAKADRVCGYFAANSFKRLRVMTCMEEGEQETG
jgi:hypothetical protein